MKTTHRYILEPYKGMNTRYRCPHCEKPKSYTRYINAETGQYLGDNIGKCERLLKCGFHQLPPLETKCLNVPFKEFKEYNSKTFLMTVENEIRFYLPKSQVYEVLNTSCYVSEWYLNNTLKKPEYFTTDIRYYTADKTLKQICNIKSEPLKPQQRTVNYIPVDQFKASLIGQETNHFVKYLIDLFGVEVAGKLVSQYFIGNSKHQFTRKDFPDYKSEKGATVFWQIDTHGKVRTGKIMLYSPFNGKRIKEPFNHVTWVHSLLKTPVFELKQCLFGEHLLIDKSKPVAIVESEKTAIIASIYLPQFIWLAVGSLSNLNAEKCQVLKGRQVTLFPDLNGFEKWSIKAKELSHITFFIVSDLLERKANEAERKQGLDLADFLIRFNYKDFEVTKPIKKTFNLGAFPYCNMRKNHLETFTANPRNHKIK